MSDLAIPVEGIEFPRAATFVGTRDVVRTIVEKIGVAFAPTGLVVALETAMERSDPDILVVCDGAKTVIFPVMYSPLLLRIDGVPHFIGGKDGVRRAASELAATVEGVSADVTR